MMQTSNTEIAERISDPFQWCEWLPSLYAAKESASHLYFRRRISRCNARSAGWTAARGDVEWGALVMFAIVFFWQFPHFFSIAWLYREDYEAGRIRMLPVVEPDGRSTSFRILLYSLALIPVSTAPTLLGMAGWIYFFGALFLGVALLCIAVRLAALQLPLQSTLSKQRARQLLQATVFYLPTLFVLMILDTASS
jgi:protoheme IX farnesyltransferase